MKKKYESPKIQLHKIALENGIATGSAKVRFIATDETNTPSAEAWTINPNQATDSPTKIDNW